MPKKLAPEVAEQVMLKAGLIPLDPYVNSGEKWRCKCRYCGNEVFPKLYQIRNGAGGCYPCGIKRRIDPQKYSHEDAKQIMTNAGILPLTPYDSAQSKWKSECMNCGEIIFPRLSNIISKQKGCIKCGYKSSNLKQRLSDSTISKVLAKANMTLVEPYINSLIPLKCKCLKCNALITPYLHSLKKGSGCTECGTTAFQYNKPAYLYLITHTQLNAHKIGIGMKDSSKDRLTTFIYHGWTVFGLWNAEYGRDVANWEKEIFNVIRKNMKIPAYLSSTEMPLTGGHTETMGADSITLLELEKIIKKVIKGYRQ